MQKTREKITALQKELDAQKTEAENLQIVQLVRSMRMSPQEFKAFLSGEQQQYDNQPEETTETTEPESTPPPNPVALTPDGNLTLVDDIDGEQAEDKQFIPL